MQKSQPISLNPLNQSKPQAQQQNININISYNLNTHKLPKSIVGAKKTTSKNKKIQEKPIPNLQNQFFSNLALNAISEGKKIVKKQNLSKKSNQLSISYKQTKGFNEKQAKGNIEKQTKVHADKQTKNIVDKKINTKVKKSKQIQNTQISQKDIDMNNSSYNYKDVLKRNIQSPDIFKVQNNRKLKTQVSYQDANSTYKKLKKSSLYAKDIDKSLLYKPSKTLKQNPKINSWMKQSSNQYLVNKFATNYPLKKLGITSKTPKNKKSVSFAKQKQKRVHTQENQAASNQIINKHNKSCMLYSNKKGPLITQPNLVQTAEHIMSTFVNSNNLNKGARKRAQSAYSFTRNDKKLVSKLLNMSIISSELGSSQLISSQRIKSSRNQITRKKLGLKVDQLQNFNNYGSNQGSFFRKQNQPGQNSIFQSSMPGNALRQFLNSIDLRVIKNIQDDTANIQQQRPSMNSKQNKQLEFGPLIQNDLQSPKIYKKSPQSIKNKKLRIEQLQNNGQEQKSINKEQIITFYNKLFNNALQNKRIQQQQQKYLDSANSEEKPTSFDLNQTNRLKKQKFIIQNFDLGELQQQASDKSFTKKLLIQSSQSQRDSKRQIYENIKQQKPQKNSLKLSFNNYKDILNQHANKVQQQNKNRNQIQNQKFNNNNFQKTNTFGFFLKQCKMDDNHVGLDQQTQQNNVQFFNLQEFKKHKQQNNLLKESKPQNKKQKDTGIQLPQFQQIDDSSLSKEQQIQRWNNINKFLSQKISGRDLDSTQNNQIMMELIKQSNWNKKWIQQEQDKDLVQYATENKVQVLNLKKDQQDINYQDQFTAPKQTKKSPKASIVSKKSRQKKFQPFYNEVCWEYDANDLQNQIQNSKAKIQKQNENTKKHKIYTNNSPNNFSQQAIYSGQEQYDSKKYSQASIYKDVVVQYHTDEKQENNICSLNDKKDLKRLQDTNNQTKEKNEQKINKIKQQDNKRQKQIIKRLIDSFDQQDEQDISCEQKEINSCEQKEINCQNRWISDQKIYQNNRITYQNNKIIYQNNRINKQQSQKYNVTEERIRKYKIDSNRNKDRQGNKQKSQQIKNNQNDYLECQLSSFGFKTTNNYQLKQRKSSNQAIQKQTPKLNGATQNSQTNIQRAQNKIIVEKNAGQNQESQQMKQLLQLNDVLNMIQNEEQDIQSQFIKLKYHKQEPFNNIIKNYQNHLKNQIAHQVSTQNQENKQIQNWQKNEQNKQASQTQTNDKFAAIRKKRLTHIVQDIILQLIKQFAKDISYILKKSTTHQKRLNKQFQQNTSPFKLDRQPNDFQKELSPFSKADEQFQFFSPKNKRQQIQKKNQFLAKTFGIDTSFHSIQKYLKEFKTFLLANQDFKKQMVKNINKDIGPNSLQILSYLRPQYQTSQRYATNENQNQVQQQKDNFSQCQDEDGLFIVPSQAFSQYQNYIEHKRQQHNKNIQPQKQIILSQKQKRNLNFWHRGIYESWNQFLDCERPFGINGKPYDWVQQRKKFRQIRIEQIESKLQKGIQKLLQAISLPTGIIYDKYDIQAMYADLSEQQKMFLNEERLSRMLAIQLLESQELWINYNDQMAQLLVQLSRVIQQNLMFEMSAQFKKLTRKRNILISQKNNHLNSQSNLQTQKAVDSRMQVN